MIKSIGEWMQVSVAVIIAVAALSLVIIMPGIGDAKAQIEKEGQIGQYIGEIRGTSIDVYRFSNGGTICYLTNGPNGRGAMSCIH